LAAIPESLEADTGNGLEQDTVLGKARTLWKLGDWSSLLTVVPRNLNTHPDRAKLALLRAAAHQRLGDLDAASDDGQAALRWGCSRQLMARLMLGGLYDTLALAAAAQDDRARAAELFRSASLLLNGGRELDAADGARAVREMARSGLLPEASNLLGTQLDSVRQRSERTPELDARINVIESELELLQGALLLAQQRGQLHMLPPGDANTPPSQPIHTSYERARARSMSQLGQDMWILERTAYKRGGYFVEFGAADGVLLSNTHLLEHEFGWQGLCAEPNPKLFDKLRQNRQCTVSEACIAAESGLEVEFVFADAYGTMVDYANYDSHAAKRDAYRRSGEVGRVITVSLQDFLVRYGAPNVIDYLSIDTEGSEYDILRTFPFERWRINHITVEHNFTPRRADIRSLLAGRGYRCTECQWDDWYELTAPN
jgi:FkbM family methyltransferase